MYQTAPVSTQTELAPNRAFTQAIAQTQHIQDWYGLNRQEEVHTLESCTVALRTRHVHQPTAPQNLGALVPPGRLYAGSCG